MPTGATGWCELVDHARSLGDLSEVDWFELKGTLSFTARADRKRSAVTLARAVLGMANRMPDTSAKHLSGHGVVLVGIDGHEILGAEQVDGAQLHDALDPYVGQNGLHWDYTFIDHPDGLVMAVTVDPPKWGDSIYTFQKEFSDDGTNIRDGEIFVRVPGKTRPATSQDNRELQRRLLASPSSGADVVVEYDGMFDRINSQSAHELVESIADRVADSLLATLPAPKKATTPYGITLPTPMVIPMGQKSQRQFRNYIEDWREEAYSSCALVATEFIRHELAHGRLRIANASDRYLEGVRVEVRFPPGVSVLVRSDTDYCDHGGPFNFSALMPERPSNWEKFNSYASFLGPGLGRIVAAPLSPRTLGSEFEVQEGEEGTVLRWELGDLHPRGRETSDEEVAVCTDGHAEVLPMQWRVTSRGVNHVFQGEETIACAEIPMEHLMWRRTDNDGNQG